MKTKSQRLARKSRGRPPQDVPRTASGQPSRKPDPAVLAPVLRAQCLRHGIPATDANMALMADPRTRTPWGLAVLAGHITDRDAEGVRRFLALRHRYLACIGAPYEHPRIASVLSEAVGGGAGCDWAGEDEEDRERALVARYNAAVSALKATSGIAWRVICQMAGGTSPRGATELAAMRSAARVLADHFGVEG